MPTPSRGADENHIAVARRGRDPALDAYADGRNVCRCASGRASCWTSMAGHELPGHGDPARPYGQALATQGAKIEEVALDAPPPGS